MKLVLMAPKGPMYRHRTGCFGWALRYQPLTLTTLAALVPPELDVEVELLDEPCHDKKLRQPRPENTGVRCHRKPGLL